MRSQRRVVDSSLTFPTLLTVQGHVYRCRDSAAQRTRPSSVASSCDRWLQRPVLLHSLSSRYQGPEQPLPHFTREATPGRDRRLHGAGDCYWWLMRRRERQVQRATAYCRIYIARVIKALPRRNKREMTTTNVSVIIHARRPGVAARMAFGVVAVQGRLARLPLVPREHGPCGSRAMLGTCTIWHVLPQVAATSRPFPSAQCTLSQVWTRYPLRFQRLQHHATPTPRHRASGPSSQSVAPSALDMYLAFRRRCASAPPRRAVAEDPDVVFRPAL